MRLTVKGYPTQSNIGHFIATYLCYKDYYVFEQCFEMLECDCYIACTGIYTKNIQHKIILGSGLILALCNLYSVLMCFECIVCIPVYVIVDVLIT